ncbi:helix-turn-helix domain-containing protein [Microbispora sp. NPDC004025]
MTRTTPDTHEQERRSLGALIRTWRDRALLTQEQLADRAGVNVRTIGRFEGDAVRRPRSASLQRLAEALGLDGRERAALAAAAGRMSGRPEPGEDLRQEVCACRPPAEATPDLGDRGRLCQIFLACACRCRCGSGRDARR